MAGGSSGSGVAARDDVVRSRGAAAPDRTRFAAVDLGTNNCRLLVARPDSRGFRVLDAYSRIVRLGEGLTASGALSEAAMRRSIGALGVCAARIRRMRVRHARYVATEACRQARNCDEFLARVETETGIALEIIPAEEEARLALAGCVPLLSASQEFALVFDIGGGSTELVWARVLAGKAPQIIAWTSVPYGVVTLAERFGGHEVDTDAYAAMVQAVEAQIARFEQTHRLAATFAAGRAQMVGISGTITTLAAVQLGLPRYDRRRVDGRAISLEAVGDISRRLVAMSYDQRVANPCILKGRADLVIPGCAVLEAILAQWPAPEVRVADRGLRDGILWTMMRNTPVVAESTARRE